MEEFEYKFSRNDPVLAVNTVRTLVERLRGFSSDGNKIEYDKYYKYLKGKCLQGDAMISSACIDGLWTLCEDEKKEKAVLDVEVVLNDFLTSLQLQNISSVVHLIFKSMGKIDFLKYGIMFNQHPLITVLRRDEHSWIPILTNVEKLLESNPDANLLNKLQPFILYSLYDCEHKVNEMFQVELLKIHLKSPDEVLLYKIMLYNKRYLTRTVRYAKEISKRRAFPLAPLIICIRRTIESNSDASEAIFVFKREAERTESADVSVELSLLVDCLQIAPLFYLNDILKVCLRLLSKCTFNHRALCLLKSSLLKCKLNLIPYNERSFELMALIDEVTVAAVPKKLDSAGKYLILDVETFVNSEIQKDVLAENVGELKNCPISFLKTVHNYLLSVLYESTDADSIKSLLKILIKTVEGDALKTSQLLSVVLYKLANCFNPRVNFELVKTFPKLSALKENLPLILTTVKTFSVYSPKLQNLALYLLYEIFCVDIRCFSYLQDLLVRDVKGTDREIRKYAVTKAYVLKELCRKNAHSEVYGSELAGYISKILSGSRDRENSLVQALALEGLKHLCKNDIIDIRSAWESLRVHYENDRRTDVVKSLCEMLSEISNETACDVKQEQLLEGVVRQLWSYTMSDDLVIVRAAYDALGQFSLEQVSVCFPEKYAVGTCNAFGNIPGVSWVNLLSKCRKQELKYAGDFLRTLIATEVKNFKNHVYTVTDGRGEPDKFELPAYSVLAAIFNHVKSQVSKWKTIDRAVYLECLRVLSFKYSKPLPPADWCFLQELIHEDETRKYCLRIAAHQVILSGTARRLVENYILALTEETELTADMILIYECFVYLSNSIQPIIVKPFVAKTLDLAISEFLSGSEESLLLILDCFKRVLEEISISDVNKIVISDEIIDKLYKLDYNSKVFDAILTCVHVIPIEKLDAVSSPLSFLNVTPDILQKCLKIRCTAAVNSYGNPFNYLNLFNECPNVKCDLTSDGSKYLSFRSLYNWLRLVFVKHRNHAEAIEWLIELMAKIQLELADEQNFSTVLFKCSVFITAVCVYSGMDTFRINSETFKEYSECFPYALCSILKDEKWKGYSVQILEWLYDVSTNKLYKKPPEAEGVVSVFKTSLLCARNEEAFNEKLRWMKYIEINL